MDNLDQLREEIITCRLCDRLVTWREQIAAEKVKRHADETYWGKPIPGFGDPNARLLVIGLAPAAHGANRTGRVFTGDRSGDWLYRGLYKAGFANQPTSTHADDGLVLTDAYVTSTARCAPPQNKLTPAEISHCKPFLLRELKAMSQIQVIIALGKVGYDAISNVYYRDMGLPPETGGAKTAFGHNAESVLPGGIHLIGSYHPSQQNTFTGRLTEPMFDAVFNRAKALLG